MIRDYVKQRWPVIVTTTNRKTWTLGRTVEGLDRGGFAKPLIYCDGPAVVPAEYEIVGRKTQVGAWPSWLASLRELADRFPAADRYVVCQDDIVCCRNLRQYVETTLPDTSVCQLWTSANYTNRISPMYAGWQAVADRQNLLGAGLFIIPHLQAWSILCDPRINRYRMDGFGERPGITPGGLHHIDTVIGLWAVESNETILIHVPSLTDHIGRDSVMYPAAADKRARRQTGRFVGEDFDAMRLA